MLLTETLGDSFSDLSVPGFALFQLNRIEKILTLHFLTKDSDT